MTKSRLLALVVIVIVVFLAIYFRPVGKRQQVLNRFEALAQAVSRGSGENVLVMALRTEALKDMFTNPCSLTVPEGAFSGDYSPTEVYSLTMRSRAMFSSLNMRFYDFRITFPSDTVADVTVTVRVTGEVTSREKNVDESREIQCVLWKVEKQWLFHSCEVVEVLKK